MYNRVNNLPGLIDRPQKIVPQLMDGVISTVSKFEYFRRIARATLLMP